MLVQHNLYMKKFANELGNTKYGVITYFANEV